MMHCVLQLIVIGLVVLMLIFEPYHENCGAFAREFGSIQQSCCCNFATHMLFNLDA